MGHHATSPVNSSLVLQVLGRLRGGQDVERPVVLLSFLFYSRAVCWDRKPCTFSVKENYQFAFVQENLSNFLCVALNCFR